MIDDRLKALARAFETRMSKARSERTNDLDQQQKIFFSRSFTTSSYYITLVSGLTSGRFKKPSEFVQQELGWAFGTFLPADEHHRAALVWAVDNCTRFPYAEGWNRRPLRTKNYLPYCNMIVTFILGFTARIDYCDDICDMLSGNIPEDLTAYLNEYSYMRSGYNPVEIAYELNCGNARLKEIIRDILCGEGNAQISHRLLRGIMMSDDTELHELVGKLLLSARLQEGLRQAICETCDEGTTEAFITILEVIEKNNLIRFSSVKRAVGTWLGLISEEAADLTRISDKSINLIVECLKNPAARETYLQSEDSMALHIALWSYAIYEAQDAITHIVRFAKEGTHHQILTCGYTMHLFNNLGFEYSIACEVISRHFDQQDILAVYMSGLTQTFSKISMFQYGKELNPANSNQSKRPEKAEYFKDDAQFEHFYEIFCTLYRSMKKKTVEFSPCIFPWHSEKLTKASIAEVICCLARLSEDNDRIDFACSLLPETNAMGRSRFAQMLTAVPATQVQKDTLTSLLGDRESFTRQWAYKQLKEMSCDTLNFKLLEDMLRFKTSDIRSNLVELLLRQSDEALFDTIRRLLGDKLEEKRCAALDLVLQISRDENRRALTEKCIPLVKDIIAKGSKEKVLLESVQGEILDKQEAAVDALCSKADEYVPVLPADAEQYAKECISAFETCFPDSAIRKMMAGDFSMISDAEQNSDEKCPSCAQADADILSLIELIEQHKEDSYIHPYSKESRLLGYSPVGTRLDENGKLTIPLHELWDKWYQTNINDPLRLMRMKMLLILVDDAGRYGSALSRADKSVLQFRSLACALMGKGFTAIGSYSQLKNVSAIVSYLLSEYPVDGKLTEKMTFAACWWMLKALPDDLLVMHNELRSGHVTCYSDPAAEYASQLDLLCDDPHMARILSHLMYQTCDRFDIVFPALTLLKERLIGIIRREMNYPADRPVTLQTRYTYVHHSHFGTAVWKLPGLTAYLRTWHEGMISERTLYRFIFTSDLVSNITTLTSLSAFHHQSSVSSRNARQYWRAYTVKNSLTQIFGKTENFSEEELSFLADISRISDRAVDAIVTDELRRGDTPAPCSAAVPKIYKIYGAQRLVAILAALGNDALRENTTYHSNNTTKRSNLLSLLGSCVPAEDDSAETLKKYLAGSGISRQRLIEAALYSPEWIDIIGEYLNLPAFKSAAYYFMAHMNESFDDRRKAIIAQFTPLTADELNTGAFDLNWFRSAYNALGAEDFDRVYDAAKYITSGTLHMRARKYADAALGRMDVDKTKAQISDKRNKDLLMAYPVIPLSDEDDISRRYLFLQDFLKGSKQFGAQRIASEKAAVEIALTNLAINAGFADVSRLTLRMESRLIEEKRALFTAQKIDEIDVQLVCDADGQVTLAVCKKGKALKSVPAKYKKHELILEMNEAKKMLTDQRSRTIRLMEEAMENGTAFTAEEIALLMKNPVLMPLISRLVFLWDEQSGFVELQDDALSLVTSAGEVMPLAKDASLIVAHPWQMYKGGVWTAFQNILFERGIVQPFKQVFRELYIKTADELGRTNSLRYAGNQIQPARTLGCLKTRHWVADVESGIQKIYYKENIIAHIFALADWFSPADIEAPTLEWVEFTDRASGKAIRIDDVPEIIFSEVMRDVDMAVSVAHAGGVDPETSHSTIEMREALLRCTLPLFRLSNVRVENQKALIAGTRAEYTVHLGSGVIHQKGGAMISVLPVHFQHRGKLFLPFADEDPKTAEIISKVLLFAEDQKIKDPTILSQIML